jgi:hypothetical protein
MNGSLSTIDDRPANPSERRLSHSQERVGRGVTIPQPAFRSDG